MSYLIKLPPAGIKPPNINTVESRKSVLTVVSKGDLVHQHWLLKFSTEINFNQDGIMPVFVWVRTHGRLEEEMVFT